MPSALTWRSAIASSNAACVLGGVRLISSASSRLVNIGPRRKTTSWVRGSSTTAPVSAGAARRGSASASVMPAPRSQFLQPLHNAGERRAVHTGRAVVIGKRLRRVDQRPQISADQPAGLLRFAGHVDPVTVGKRRGEQPGEQWSHAMVVVPSRDAGPPEVAGDLSVRAERTSVVIGSDLLIPNGCASIAIPDRGTRRQYPGRRDNGARHDQADRASHQEPDAEPEAGAYRRGC